MHALDKSSQNFHKEISTHLLTVLTISVILQLEQRKVLDYQKDRKGCGWGGAVIGENTH